MAKSAPIDDATLQAVAAALYGAWKSGCPVAPQSPEAAENPARVMIRRWRSARRRGVDESDRAARIRDLVKGMVEQWGDDPKLLGPLVKDYEYLAGEAAKVL